MLGQRRRRWARIGPALGQRLVFAGSVDRLLVCVSHIAGCEDIKTVSQLIEPNDDLFTVDIKNGFHHIKIHISTFHRSHLLTLITKAIVTTCISAINLNGDAAGEETSPVFCLQKN